MSDKKVDGFHITKKAVRMIAKRRTASKKINLEAVLRKLETHDIIINIERLMKEK